MKYGFMRKKAFGIILLFFTVIILVSVFCGDIIRAILHRHIVYGMDLHHFYSWSAFTTANILEGKIPLWATYTFGGYPFLASLQPAIFYPATLLHLFLPINLAYNLEIIITILLMSLFIFLWLREFLLSEVSILFGTIIFVFSGFVAYRIYAGHISVLRGFLWLPLVFYLTQRAIKTKNKPTFFGLVILCAWALGFQITSGIPQFVIYTLLNLSLFVLLTEITSKEKILMKGISFIILTCLFCSLLFAVQVLPTIEGFKYSSLDRSFDYATVFSLPFYGLITFVSPGFFGSPLDNSYRAEVTGGYFWELENYISIIGLFLVIFAIYSLRKKLPPRLKNIIVIMSFLSFFSLLIALGKNTPFLKALSYIVPGIRGTRVPSRILGVLSFSLATISSCGFEIFSSHLKEGMGRFKNKKLIVAFILSVILLATFSDLYIHNAKFIRQTKGLLPDNQRLVLEKLAKIKREDPVSYWRVDAEEMQNFGFIYSIENIRGANTFRLALFDNLVKNLDTNTLRKLLNVKYVVLPLSGLKTFAPADFFMENSLEQKPKLSEGRVLVEENIGARYETFAEGSYKITCYLKVDNSDSLNNFTVAQIKVLDSKGGLLASKAVKAIDFNAKNIEFDFSLNNPEALKIAVVYVPQSNVKLWLERVEIFPWFKDSGKIVYQDSSLGLIILKNDDFLPRIAFVPFVYLADIEEMLSILRDKTFNPRRVVLLESGLRGEFKDIAVDKPDFEDKMEQEEAKIKIRKYTPDEILFSCDSPKKGILLLSQIFYPGWQAQIDGRKGHILRANYAFCGIPVTAGLHQIRLFYQPWYWKFAVITSLSMLVFSLAYLIILIVRRGKWAI